MIKTIVRGHSTLSPRSPNLVNSRPTLSPRSPNFASSHPTQRPRSPNSISSRPTLTPRSPNSLSSRHLARDCASSKGVCGRRGGYEGAGYRGPRSSYWVLQVRRERSFHSWLQHPSLIKKNLHIWYLHLILFSSKSLHLLHLLHLHPWCSPMVVEWASMESSSWAFLEYRDDGLTKELVSYCFVGAITLLSPSLLIVVSCWDMLSFPEQLIYTNKVLEFYTMKLYFYVMKVYWFWWLSMCIAEISRSSWHYEENSTTLRCFKWAKMACTNKQNIVAIK